MSNNVRYKSIADVSYDILIQQLSDYLLKRYGIQVVEKEVVDDVLFVGSYDGNLITLKNTLSDEHKLFLLAHLFGHTIQWLHNSDKYTDIVQILPTHRGEQITTEQLDRLKRYEYEAAAYAIQLLQEGVEVDLTQWFSDWSNADWEYFINLSKFNESPQLILKYGTELILSREIPKITLKKFDKKYAY